MAGCGTGESRYPVGGGGAEGGGSSASSVVDLRCRLENGNVAKPDDFQRWKDIVMVRWIMYEEQRKYNMRCQSMPVSGNPTIWRILSMVQQELEEKLQIQRILGSCRRFPSPMALMDSERTANGELRELEVVRAVLCGTKECSPAACVPEKGHHQQQQQQQQQLQSKPLTPRREAEFKWQSLPPSELFTSFHSVATECPSPCQLESQSKPIKQSPCKDEFRKNMQQEQQPKWTQNGGQFQDDPAAKNHRNSHSCPANETGLPVPADALLQLAEELPPNATWSVPKKHPVTGRGRGRGRGRGSPQRPRRITEEPGYALRDPLLIYVNEKFHLDANSWMGGSIERKESITSFYSALDVSAESASQP